MDLAAQLADAWGINNRINLTLIDHVSDTGMSATLSTRGGRTVSRQFAHVHMVRVRWLENAGGRDLVAAVPRFESKDAPSRAQLKKALTASGAAIATYLEDSFAGRRQSKSLKRGVGVWFGYLIAHEAHHRGSILLTLKQSGQALDESLRWGIWEWGQI